MTTAAGIARSGGMEPSLRPNDLAAIRTTRLQVVDAVQTGEWPAVQPAIEQYVHSMWEADFSTQTMRALVNAAVDAGLAWRRGRAHATARRRTVDESVACANAIIARLGRRHDA